eukprot:2298801-Alexandrium_andersonii.AAC.1
MAKLSAEYHSLPPEGHQKLAEDAVWVQSMSAIPRKRHRKTKAMIEQGREQSLAVATLQPTDNARLVQGPSQCLDLAVATAGQESLERVHQDR